MPKEESKLDELEFLLLGPNTEGGLCWNGRSNDLGSSAFFPDKTLVNGSTQLAGMIEPEKEKSASVLLFSSNLL
jgi:hypothetical protein